MQKFQKLESERQPHLSTHCTVEVETNDLTENDMKYSFINRKGTMSCTTAEYVL